MSTFEDRGTTALLVIDLQQGVTCEAIRADEILRTVAGLVDRARIAEVPVVWVQHSSADLPLGSDEWGISAPLAPQVGDSLVNKTYGDAFEDTCLTHVLEAAGVDHLVVVGAESDACIRSTIHGAFTRGYDVTLVSDAHTTSDKTSWGAPSPEDVIAHLNLCWQYQRAPGRTAAVVESKQVNF